jgi:hypothetical protein
MDFIARRNTITPATSKAAPASKVIPEFEPFIDNHINSPTAIKPPEINISRRCALRIRMRGELKGMAYILLLLYYGLVCFANSLDVLFDDG